LKDQVDDFWGVSPRYILQNIGTGLFRNDLQIYLPNLKISKTFWIENFFRWFKKNAQKKIIVSDCRFPDERQALKDCGFKLFRVVRPCLNVDYLSNHESEMLQKSIQVDKEIINDGSLQELYTKVDNEIIKNYV
jgi:hypothetical protein